MSPKVTGQNHLPWPCLVPRISHALSHQTVRFTTTHSLSSPTSSTGPCACFVPLHKTPILKPKVFTHHYQMRTLCLRVLFFACSFVFCHLFACCLFSSLFRTMVLCRILSGEYVHILLSALLSPNYAYCPWTVFSHIMPWSHIQSREELISAFSSHTMTSLSVWSWPLTFLIAASQNHG